MVKVELSVNGNPVACAIEPRTLLVDLLRDELALTGTHIGCDTSQCGACIVHLDGRSVKSCTVLAVQASGKEVLTIEGLTREGEPFHPMQQAFHDHHALQCGYCTPGMVLSAVELVGELSQDSDENEIRSGLKGNICRCTGYHNIVKAIRAVLQLPPSPSRPEGA